MSDQNYDAASPEEKQHFFQCGECGEWIDCRCLDEVFKHETDHKERPDIQYAGAVRINQ
ncbi:MAG TPA: hypothetical protein VGY56_10490 [Verrucomicrobiae bacterium]|nr:hypothetical protein [Verrucomicrobiae bacterium]